MVCKFCGAAALLLFPNGGCSDCREIGVMPEAPKSKRVYRPRRRKARRRVVKI